MTILWSNNASTTVSGSITPVSTTVSLAAGTGVLFPQPTGTDYFVATFYDQATKTQNEIVHVTNITGDVATIVRAQEGTTARAWNAGDLFANLVTAGTLRNFVQSGAGPAPTSIVYVGTDISTTPGLIVCNTVPVPANYAVGMLFNIKVNNTNLGPVQLQLNGVAAVTATRTDGSPMVGGNLVATEEMIFVYNGVNFTSMVPPIPQAPPQTVFYVRPDGNDNNTGFANTPASAFLTISGAMTAIKSRYISQNTITVRVADGLYVDAFGDGTNYISSWNIIGNTTNPGNVVINATSITQTAYPPHASIARCVTSYYMANISVSGFTFQSYYENVAATNGGVLQITSCNFTAPTSGVVAPIAGYVNAKTFVYGNCQYSGSTPTFAIFNSIDGGSVLFGYHDAVQTITLVFNIAGTPTITDATAVVDSAGNMVMYNAAVSFTGGVPACKQYDCSTGGGISFQSGVTNIFPGTLPGTVTSPGWIN
jgi:hypothetical protein